MESLISKIKEMNPILQGALGSALFAFILWLIRYVYFNITNTIKKVRLKRESAELIRYFILHHLVGSNGLYYYSQGYFYVFYRVLKDIVLAFMILIFGLVISKVFPIGSFFLIVFGAISINILLDTYGWFNLNLSKGDLSNYDQDLVKRIRDSVLDERLKARDLKREKSDRENEVSRLQAQIEKLKDQLDGFSEDDKDI
jgi:hypothetical protein